MPIIFSFDYLMAFLRGCAERPCFAVMLLLYPPQGYCQIGKCFFPFYFGNARFPVVVARASRLGQHKARKPMVFHGGLRKNDEMADNTCIPTGKTEFTGYFGNIPETNEIKSTLGEL